jgi:hypothetical protein
MSLDDHEIIGWKESVDLIDWGVLNIVAKSDTGARRSAIDVKNITELPDGYVRFDIALHRKKRNRIKTVVAKIAHQTHVRSSNGEQHERYFVATRIRIGERIKEIELSLVCRKNMTCRMLLGRKALQSDFLVDSLAIYMTRPRGQVNLLEDE